MTPASRRMAAMWARRRRGLAVYRLDLPEFQVIDRLIDHGLLTEIDCIDQQQVEKALSAFVIKALGK